MSWKTTPFIIDAMAVVFWGALVTCPCLVARSWYVEARSRFSLETPRWRSVLALGALVFASVSVLLSLAYFLRMRTATHIEISYLDPFLWWFMAGGFLSTATALPCALIGKGRARWSSLGITLFMASYWYVALMDV